MPTREPQTLKRRLVPFAFVAALTVQGDSCGPDEDFGLHEQEFLCEDADARLMECCGKSAGLYCTRPHGCVKMRPDLSVKDSLCIRDSSCAQLEAAGACGVTDWTGFSMPSDGSTMPALLRTVKEALRCP